MIKDGQMYYVFDNYIISNVSVLKNILTVEYFLKYCNLKYIKRLIFICTQHLLQQYLGILSKILKAIDFFFLMIIITHFYTL